MENGILTIYSLQNNASAGDMPVDKLVESCTAYYSEQTVGVTRSYAAIAANQQIDALVRCYNTDLSVNDKYVILEDGNQYRISLAQKRSDGGIDLTLERLGVNYDIAE